MFNIFAPILLEKLHGKKLSVMLAEEQGKTERTWRNRMSSGWVPTPEECEDVRNQVVKVFRKKLISYGWTDQEATEIIARNPAWKDEAGLLTANLIFLTAPNFETGYEEAISVAIGFDRVCHAIAVAFQAKDLASATQSLLAASNWLKSYFPEDEGLSYLDELERKIHQAADLAEMQAYCNKLGSDMIGHVMSCWDLNFCSSYFDGMLQAFPMFALVMPRPAPNIEIG